MELYVRLAKPDVDALIELQHWLAHDDRFPAPARQARPGPPRQGQLGTTTDVLQLVDRQRDRAERPARVDRPVAPVPAAAAGGPYLRPPAGRGDRHDRV